MHEVLASSLGYKALTVEFACLEADSGLGSNLIRCPHFSPSKKVSKRPSREHPQSALWFLGPHFKVWYIFLHEVARENGVLYKHFSINFRGRMHMFIESEKRNYLCFSTIVMKVTEWCIGGQGLLYFAMILGSGFLSHEMTYQEADKNSITSVLLATHCM